MSEREDYRELTPEEIKQQNDEREAELLEAIKPVEAPVREFFGGVVAALGYSDRAADA